MNPETDALTVCCNALEPLADTERERVLLYLRERFDSRCLEKMIESLRAAYPDKLRNLPTTRADSAGPNSPSAKGWAAP